VTDAISVQLSPAELDAVLAHIEQAPPPVGWEPHHRADLRTAYVTLLSSKVHNR
jgi:hypothetical protein